MEKRRANSQTASSFVAKAKAARACVLNKVQGSFHSKTQKCFQNKNGMFSRFSAKKTITQQFSRTSLQQPSGFNQNASAPNTPASLAHGASAATKQEKLHRLMPIASAMLVALCIGLLLAVLFAKYAAGVNGNDSSRVANYCKITCKSLSSSNLVKLDRATTSADYTFSVTGEPLEESRRLEVGVSYDIELSFPESMFGYSLVVKNGDKSFNSTMLDGEGKSFKFSSVGSFAPKETRTDTLTLTVSIADDTVAQDRTFSVDSNNGVGLKVVASQID